MGCFDPIGLNVLVMCSVRRRELPLCGGWSLGVWWTGVMWAVIDQMGLLRCLQ